MFDSELLGYFCEGTFIFEFRQKQTNKNVSAGI
jgi:hypothetical protein